MVTPTRPPANAFVKVARRVYNPIGFAKGYNFVLYVIFAGALLGFCLARLQFLAINGIFCNLNSTTGSAAPGECYWYSMRRYHIGIILHLATILPAGILAVFQFVPGIRHNYLIYHRVAGYLVILLVLLSIAGALMITDHSFGGHIATQAAVGLLAIASTLAILNAYYNIKRLQIDQHRAWMLRVWFWMSSIVTLRIIQQFSAIIISKYYSRGWYQIMPCAELLYIANSVHMPVEAIYGMYPACAPGNANLTIDGQVVVKADHDERPEQQGAALGITFPMAMWLALVIHAVGVEVYLALTPREAERLRKVSYQRQLEAGMANPGNAGLVPERFGDMDVWEPQLEQHTAGSSVTVQMEEGPEK